MKILDKVKVTCQTDSRLKCYIAVVYIHGRDDQAKLY